VSRWPPLCSSGTHRRRPPGVRAPSWRAADSHPHYTSAAANLERSTCPGWQRAGFVRTRRTRRRVGPTKILVVAGRSCRIRRGRERRSRRESGSLWTLLDRLMRMIYVAKGLVLSDTLLCGGGNREGC
jgi:hypothetical protein